MSTGWLSHELFMWHDTGTSAGVLPAGLTVQPGIPYENPEPKRRFRNLVEVSGLADRLVRLQPRCATEAELARVHTPGHIANIKALSDAGGGEASPLTPLGRGSFEIARLAAGGVIVAVEAVIQGRVSNAYTLVRPPGHHAVADLGMGFCLFANAAIAIRHAQERFGLRRIATVDWDVHHGNGSQSIFYADPRVLTVSLHQDRLYPPDSGGLEENGTGPGQRLQSECPAAAWKRQRGLCRGDGPRRRSRLGALPAQLIVVPCGFDASGLDPLGRMLVSSDGFRAMTKLLKAAAERLCGGRIVMVHEGGYSESYVPYCGLAVLEALAGIDTGVEDSWAPRMAAWGQQSLQPHQAEAIAQAERLLANIS